MKTVFMGTPDFAAVVLDSVVKAGFEVGYVITQPDKARDRGKKIQFTPVKEKALEYGLEVLQPKKKKKNAALLEQLQEYPLICLGSETMTYAFYRQLYLRCGLELEPDTEAATTDQILPMVQSGLGLGFVPRPLAEPALASGQVFQVDLVETIPLRQIALIRDTRRSPSPAARQFLRLLCEGQEVLTETEGRA